MLLQLNLPVSDQIMKHHAAVSVVQHNKNVRLLKKDDLEAQENHVWKAIMSFEPLLADMISEKYAKSN